jgi:predicted nucleic acid-binding protein
MPTLVLIDTNVLVYAVDKKDMQRQERAISVLNTLAETYTGRLSVQSLGEFSNVVTRRLNPIMRPDQALVQVERLQRAFPVHDLTTMIVTEALRGVQAHRLSYYDAQIWATARLYQIPVLFSEDFNQSKLDGVQIVNPFLPAFSVETWIQR